MIDQYAVMGNPVSHSKSPFIHQAFAKQTDQILEYRAIRVEAGQFENSVTDFYELQGKGLNVTVPYKQEAWELAKQHLSQRALAAQAVNTLWFDEQANIYGDNTDGLGLVTDLTVNQKVVLKNKRILMLGAGGAARGVLLPLLELEPAELVIANRTVSRARELADKHKVFRVSASSFERLSGDFDVVINATSASLSGELPVIPKTCITSGTFCYDMMYAAEPTVFMNWSKNQGAGALSDGLGMLVEQAAESFLIWRGVRPETFPVISGLRQALSTT